MSDVKEVPQVTKEVPQVTYVKPGGQEVKINDLPGNIKEAESLGWKKKGAK